MKKKYFAPEAQLVLFETKQSILDEWGSDIGEFPTSVGRNYTYGTQGGTIVNNNGTPTVIPGGNGGGRQTPLG